MVNDEAVPIRELMAALAAGDPWLSADACAIFVGARNTRAFLRTIACKPGFPRASRITGKPKWRRSEVDAWMESGRVTRAA